MIIGPRLTDASRGWRITTIVWAPLDRVVHVTPIGDLVEHVLRGDCHCQPRLEEGCTPLWAHSSWDGRPQDDPARVRS